ncbi:serine/threonine-protein kinase pink1 [Dermatophagoides farinae]|uniref:non-specific serine/threonine protein kinase n=1 Tax=Dermatophagoides farinae TaxID=6954 RepID=A0A9D4P4H8_DERFA|nr:serine/threonine-protein kinase pink1 [Dermatophagoides farinae]
MIISNFKRQYSDSRFVRFLIRTALRQPSAWSMQRLVSSSFKRTRALIRYLFGRGPSPFLAKKFIPNKDIVHISKNLYAQSRLVRYVFRQRERVFNGTGLTFGLIGIYCRDGNGYPDLSNTLFDKPQSLDFSDFFQTVKKPIFESDELRDDITKADHIEFDDFIAKGCCGAVHKGKIKDYDTENVKNVAVKMLFNYDMSSNSVAIMNESIKECTPYRGTYGTISTRKTLSAHPNVVKILSVFVDEFKPVKNSENFYPHALPPEYGGFGHNRTLFVMQKLYDMSLKKYLILNPFPTEHCSLAILTQCFEAIDFLNKNQIAHRDLKLDNFLVQLPDNNDDYPWIVITDFGLCSTSLKIPFETDEVCKGGNHALMAPEIKTARPCKRAILDYRKADLWSMATIAYEIFGELNPFYQKQIDQQALDGANYCENHIPAFSSKLPLLASMVKQILRRNPNERPSTWLVSAYCHLLLQYGSKQMNQLLMIENHQLQDQILKNWFKQLSYRKLFEITNGNLSQISNSYRMQVMFLAKYNSNQLINIVEQSSIMF